MIFLIEYNQLTGTTISVRQFSNDERSRAHSERLKLELELNRRGQTNEVVLLEAENEMALRRTHNRYFENLDEMLHVPDADRKLRSVE